MTDEDRAEVTGIIAEIAGASQASAFLHTAYVGAAIVAALKQAGAIDPLNVAAFAEMMAGQHPFAGTQEGEGLKAFADLIRAMSTAPAGAGRA